MPSWLKKRFLVTEAGDCTQETIDRLGLNTVCSIAHCPNIGECFARKTAAFMILGNKCTRNCTFCAVVHGVQQMVDQSEPEKLATAVDELGIQHAVITSVTRDDLSDGGAGHFVSCIRELRRRCPGVVVEVLTPDFQGKADSLEQVIEARPDIYNHNVETVPRLYPLVRPQADYRRSLSLLEYVKTKNPSIYTKSGLMVGLGEKLSEIVGVMKDLHGFGCDSITIGQYLSPSPAHLTVEEYISPEIFEEYCMIGYAIGFLHVASAPFVRSSFNATDFSKIFMRSKSK